jgi:hypothetical protein
VEHKRVEVDMSHKFEITAILKKTPLGLEAQQGFRDELRESQAPVGKLIRPLRRQEIAERDGAYGKPFWIVLGQNVFDITCRSNPKAKYAEIMPCF